MEDKEKNQIEMHNIKFLNTCIQKEQHKKNRHRLYIDLIATAFIIFLLFNVITGAAVVQKDSMKPSLSNGNVALFFRLNKTYGRNDIVILHSPDDEKLLIKRIIAVAGDQIDIDNKTGTLLVNKIAQDDDLIIGKTYSREGGAGFPLTVPNGCVFILGDNREVSLDSRDFGCININKIVGTVFFVIKVL
jgi:signal peptidase I